MEREKKSFSDFADQSYYSLVFKNEARKSKFQIEIDELRSEATDSDFTYLNSRVEGEFIHNFKNFFLEFQDYIKFHLDEFKGEKRDFIQHLTNSIHASIARTKGSLFTEKKRAEAGFPNNIAYRMQGIKERETILAWIQSDLLPLFNASASLSPVKNRNKVIGTVLYLIFTKELQRDIPYHAPLLRIEVEKHFSEWGSFSNKDIQNIQGAIRKFSDVAAPIHTSYTQNEERAVKGVLSKFNYTTALSIANREVRYLHKS
ncbi:MAG: hypothetical protein IPP86_00275 [Bacteroidetes bacterium]|nr:hypothetical protein [Bacteroidota bacterium]